MIAGAIISGAYFGDKISPLSDTTNLAAATAEVSLFTHIRYMMFTTGPTMLITLVIFVILSLCSDIAPTGASVESVQQTITTHYNISPLLFIVPVIVIVMIVRKMPPVPVLFIGGIPGRDPRADLPTVGHRPTERRRGTHGRRSLPGHHQSNVRYHLDEHGRSGSRCPVHFERDGRDAEHRLVDRHRDDFRRSNGSRPFSRTPDLCPDPARTLDRGAGNDHCRNLRPVQHDRIGPIHCDRHPRQDVCESLPAKRTGARSAEPVRSKTPERPPRC